MRPGRDARDDRELFAPDRLADLRQATAHLCWLLERGYSEVASIKLVGDRFQLRQRQRQALRRAACAPGQAQQRLRKRVIPAGRRVAIDGFNLLVTLEVALRGGLLLRCRDGLLRDIASVHGSWRASSETDRAIALLGEQLVEARQVRWFLDRPVSHSGRLAQRLRQAGWDVELPRSADGAIAALCNAEPWIAATADGPLLERVPLAVDLAGPILADHSGLWLIDLG